MSIWLSILLGFVQGVSEFLPISSSGHLSVLQNLFNVQNIEDSNMFFNVLLHFATLISVCIVYRKDIADMLSELVGFFKDARHPTPDKSEQKPARRFILMIIFACLPLILVLPVHNAIEGLSSSTLFIGIAFLFTGLMLYLSDKMQKGNKTEKNMTIGNALVVGLCQAIGTLPGISRSGATITAGMGVGLNRSFAVKFSFLMSLPAILAANLYELFKVIHKGGIDGGLIPIYLLGMVVAGVTGYFAIRLVHYLAQEGKFGKFCYYCFTVGVITIVLSFIY